MVAPPNSTSGVALPHKRQTLRRGKLPHWSDRGRSGFESNSLAPNGKRRDFGGESPHSYGK